MKDQKIIILDLDDTLGNFRETASNTLNKKYNKNFSVDDWEHHLIEQLYNITKQEFISDLEELRVLERMKPHYESKSFTRSLKEQGYYIVILTARNWHPYAYNITKRWLDSWDISYDEIILCGIDDNKASIVNDRFGNVKFVVDDSPYQLWNYILDTSTEEVYMYNMPWNNDKALDICGGKRINNLLEIEGICA